MRRYLRKKYREFSIGYGIIGVENSPGRGFQQQGVNGFPRSRYNFRIFAMLIFLGTLLFLAVFLLDLSSPLGIADDPIQGQADLVL